MKERNLNIYEKLLKKFKNNKFIVGVMISFIVLISLSEAIDSAVNIYYDLRNLINNTEETDNSKALSAEKINQGYQEVKDSKSNPKHELELLIPDWIDSNVVVKINGKEAQILWQSKTIIKILINSVENNNLLVELYVNDTVVCQKSTSVYSKIVTPCV